MTVEMVSFKVEVSTDGYTLPDLFNMINYQMNRLC